MDLAAVEKLASHPPHFIAQTLCLNGQHISVTGGRVKTVVQDLTPVVGNQVATYEATSSAVQAGVSLDVITTLAPDATAFSNIMSVYSEWRPLKHNKPRSTTRPDVANPPATIGRLDMPMSEIKASVAIPIGKAVVIGGATFEPSSMPHMGDIRRLYLIIEVNVNETQ